MNVIENIEEQYQRFRANYGHRPDALYLGAWEYKRLTHLAPGPVPTIIVTPIANTPIFMGMKVYEVTSYRHIGFGIEPLSPCS